MSIYTNVHAKYGAPEKVVEFRLFLLNDCNKACESCFYKRSGNKFDRPDQAMTLLKELKARNYELESCYLLPTDFFENPDNLLEINKPEIKAILNEFEYIGLAATMEGAIDFAPFGLYMQEMDTAEVELQINLINERMLDPKYIEEVTENVRKIRRALQDKIVINLAINLGINLTDQQLHQVHYLMTLFSDDGIIEVNFTYLYNESLKRKVKRDKLIESFRTMKRLGKLYNALEPRYNQRTLLKKPAFFFIQDKVYTSAIIPFDEYIFTKSEKYQLQEISFNGFLEVITGLEKYNIPIDNSCNICENLAFCHGKGYFIAAQEYDLPCFLGV